MASVAHTLRNLSIAFFLFASFASAGAAPIVAAPRLDPNIDKALSTGRIGALASRSQKGGRVHVVVELEAEASPAILSAIEATGATLSRINGRVLQYRRFVPAEVDSASTARLAVLPSVRRVSLAPASGPRPLDQSAKLIHLAAARGARPAVGDLTGRGVTIGDVDSVVDPFHPTLFRGDGGYFDWIDVDGDKHFTPGTDAIDLDRDGKAGPGETAQALLALTYDQRNNKVPARKPDFDPGIDWLYLDQNGNGARDYGAASGFDDTTPALGEPLFVPDDVDRSGTLDVGERVVRLQTSKFRKILVELKNPDLTTAEYDRGTNLAQAQVDFTHGAAFGYPDALHATAVSSILVGDVPLVGRRWVGIAPEADLITASDETGILPVDGAMWTLGEKPDVMLYETAPWTGLPLDGSDPLSKIIDESATNDGVVHTCPTGDQGSARKHARVKPAPDTTVELGFSIPEHIPFGTDHLELVQLSIHCRGGVASALVVVDPNAQAHDLKTTVTQTLPSGAQIAARTQLTERGTSFTDAYLFSPTASVHPDVGAWKLQITAPAGASLTCDAYISDDKSSWALGAAWDPAVASDAYTIGVPSTADHCLAVNAMPAHLEFPTEPWFHFYYSVYDVPQGYMDEVLTIRAYSPRGPRIDEAIKPDVVAPDNPWTAVEHVPGGDPQAPYAAFRPFGGTSGASPHATAVAALLVQAGLHGDAVYDAIRKGAAHDDITGAVPNGDYGYGRLDAAGALGLSGAGQDFTVALSTDPKEPQAGEEVKLVATTSGDAGELQAEWDDGYDGTWDVPYSTELTHTIKASAPSTPCKVRVRDASGHVAEAIISVNTEASGCGCRLGTTSGRAPIGSLILITILALVARPTRRRKAA